MTLFWHFIHQAQAVPDATLPIGKIYLVSQVAVIFLTNYVIFMFFYLILAKEGQMCPTKPDKFNYSQKRDKFF